MSFARVSCVAGLVAMAALGGCSCDEKLVPTGQGDGGSICGVGAQLCTTSDDCPERHLCKKDNTTGGSCCVRSIRKCANESECCPGQICTADGRCVDKFDECTTASDCGETPDHICEEWMDPVLGASQRCTFARCDPSGGCPEGQACFASFCVIRPPCGGSCPAGTACVPQAAGGGRCHPFGQRCDLQPKEGHLVVFTQPDNVFDVCKLSDEACEYAALPPLTSSDLGRYPSVAISKDRAEVAMYDGTFGDLVVSDYDLSGVKLKSVWVDGVPASGTVLGGPEGPRGGIVDPGEDVGKHTSIVAREDGTLFVSYYDQSHGDLRFATRSSGGAWSSYAIDGAAADLGLYSSLALDSEGKPAVAYFQRAGSEDPSVSCPFDPGASKALITGVKLARARVAAPASASDWVVEMVDCAARPPPPCLGCSAAGKVCVVDVAAPSGTVCQDSSSDCAPSCPTGQVCARGNLCVQQGSSIELAGIPPGKGLFPSLAFKGTAPVLAYYDRTRGNLMAAQQTGGTWERMLLDGEDDTGDTGHVGSFPSLAVDSAGTLLIAYHDLTRRGLRYYSGATLAPVSQQRTPAPGTFIDTGISDPMLDGPAWVGADASLIVTSVGTFVAYQNSTAADLRLSRRTATGWKLEKEWTEGALGFFAQAVAAPEGLLVVHTKMHAKIANGKATPDHQLRLERVRPAASP
ncbi:MAG: hypothetical protein HY901_05565 [Deltaproteobacteria bacterium]|nr:hypothetical protein [Deltaproteobacteria bacterium]